MFHISIWGVWSFVWEGLAPKSPPWRRDWPGHLLYSALTCPSSGNVRRLKSKHPIIPAAQLISSSDDNRSAALWADHRWNNYGVVGEHYETPHFHPQTPAATLLEWPSPEQLVSGWIASAPVSVSAPAHTKGVRPLLQLVWVWCRRTSRRACCPRMSDASTSPCSIWPDGSGLDNRMAAEHLPRDQVRPSSGL